MSFVLRHKFTYLFGILFGFLNLLYFHFIPKNMCLLILVVISLAAFWIVIGNYFIFIFLSLNKNDLFKNLFLDLKVLESSILGVTFYFLLCVLSIIGLFITNNKNLFMSVWFTFLGFSINIIVLLIVQLFKLLYGLWTQRQNKDLYN